VPGAVLGRIAYDRLTSPATGGIGNGRRGYGEALWRALMLQRRVLHRLPVDVAPLDTADPRLAPMLDVFPTMVNNALAGLDELEHTRRGA
jgi:hypothetical protein